MKKKKKLCNWTIRSCVHVKWKLQKRNKLERMKQTNNKPVEKATPDSIISFRPRRQRRRLLFLLLFFYFIFCNFPCRFRLNCCLWFNKPDINIHVASNTRTHIIHFLFSISLCHRRFCSFGHNWKRQFKFSEWTLEFSV